METQLRFERPVGYFAIPSLDYGNLLTSMTSTVHRGSGTTAESYRGIPVHTAPGVHERVVQILRSCLEPGSRVADLGAGHGALSQRLKDSGFEPVAFELDCHDWIPTDVSCNHADLEGDLSEISAAGHFAGFCVIDVIEHLENPRGFLRTLIAVAARDGARIVLSMPNPLDTFSAISLFTRGIFNWFSPNHYAGGGHISVLPFWMVDEHLRFLGVESAEWDFISPYVHANPAKQLVYRAIGSARRGMARTSDVRWFDGQTAIVSFHVPKRSQVPL